MRNNNFYDDIMFNSDLARSEKLKRQRKVFSRLFLALFIYLFSFQLLGSLIYIVAPIALGEEKSIALLSNPISSVLISSGVQYLIAFPIFLLLTRKMEISEKTDKKKLTVGELVILFAVAELFMFLGNLVGTFLNNFFGKFIGDVPDNGIETIIEETPMWLIFIMMVIVAPIVEEVIFRKILIDRLSIYGDHIAIIFSASAFGLMHGNLYQLFYATLLGLLLGYVYTVTRDVKYTVILHSVINFFGSVIALPVQKAFTRFDELLSAIYAGFDVDMAEFVANSAITTLYTAFQYGLMLSGAIALIYRYRRREIFIATDKEIYIPDKNIAKGGIINVGTILFLVLSAILMILNLF